MSDAPPAAVQATTPVNAPNPATAGMPAGPSSSPVNATSAASKANQQAVAAGENQGLTNQDTNQANADTGSAKEGGSPQSTQEPATLSAPRFKPSGNEHIDQVTSLLHNSQFEGSDAIIDEVIDTQELSLNSKAKLVEELGADVAQLVITSLESSVKAVKEAGVQEGKRLKDYAFQKFGGSNPEETWAGLQQFAKSQTANLSAADRQTMNEMLSSGGLKAEFVIDHLFTKYKESSNYIERPALMQGDESIRSNVNLLSKKEYQEQIGPAINKYGETSQEVQALRQRRSFSLAQGYN